MGPPGDDTNVALVVMQSCRVPALRTAIGPRSAVATITQGNDHDFLPGGKAARGSSRDMPLEAVASRYGVAACYFADRTLAARL